MSSFIETVGLLAGCGTTLAFLPQFIKVWRSRSTRDISIIMYIIFCSGLALWIIYGILIHSFPLLLANIITLALASGILVMKYIFERNSKT